ncbi:unnamed protein product [Agarophyton chilense]
MSLISISHQLEAEFAAQCEQLCSAIDAAELATLPDIRAHLERIRELLGQGAEWWTKYDVRRNSEKLLSLERDVDHATLRLKPRRRFRFSQIPTSETSAVRSNGSSTMHKEAPPLGQLRNGIFVDSRSVRDGKVELKDLDGQILSIMGLKNTRVFLEGTPAALRLTNLISCDVLSVVVNGTVFISECKDCTVGVGCHQLRIHQSRSCSLWTCSNSVPIIEGCERMRFGELQVQGRRGCWDDVKDFSWLREDHSPNWQLLGEKRFFPA